MASTVPSPGAASAATRQPSEAYQRAQAYVDRVHDLCQNPGRRAALRSGLGHPLDHCPRMHAVIAGHVPTRLSESGERAYYAVAAMIASLPPGARRGAVEEDPDDNLTPQRNLGHCLAAAVSNGRVRESAAEARLSLLTRQSVNGLHRHIPATVRLFTAKPGDVDFAQLLLDLAYWDHNRHRIRRRWLQTYYRARMRSEQLAAEEADDELHQPPENEDD